MKCKFFIITFVLSCMMGVAQNRPDGNMPGPQGMNHEMPDGGNPHQGKGNFITGNRAYEIIVQKVESTSEVTNRNRSIKGIQDAREQSRGFFDTALGTALKTGYGSLVTQKAVNLTSNLVDFTVEFIGDAIKKRKERFNNWHNEAKSYRQFTKTLSQQQMIGDFYALPSYNGAFDPENIAFKGIGCRSYFSSQNNDGTRNEHDEYFYIFCSLRTDSVGMQSIVNHSKFLLEIDSIYFRPNICDIPSNKKNNISGTNNFFEQQNNLKVTLNAKIYSSWFNEAIMLQNDQLLGSFDIVMKIDSTDCIEQNGEKVFVCRKADIDKYMPSADRSKARAQRSEISIAGESFIVPRSYSMDASSSDYNPVWGTGEYRVELTLAETSDLNGDHYYADKYKPKNQSVGNGKEVAFASIPGKDYFDKSIWKTEWKEMKSAKKKSAKNGSSDSVLKDAWKEIVSTVKGSSWTTTFLSPLVNAVTTTESKAINKALKIDGTQTTSMSSSSKSTSSSSSKPSGDASSQPNGKTSQAENGMPGGMPGGMAGGNPPAGGAKP